MTFLEMLHKKRDNSMPKGSELEVPPLPTENELDTSENSQGYQNIPPPPNMNNLNEMGETGLPPLPEKIEFPTQSNSDENIDDVPPLDLPNMTNIKNSAPKEDPVVKPEPIKQNQMPSIPDLDELPDAEIPAPPIMSTNKSNEINETERDEFAIPKRVPSLEGYPQVYQEIATDEIRPRLAQGPLFIRSDKYKKVIDDLTQIKIVLKEDENRYNTLNQIKNKKEKLLEKFRQTTEDIQRKLLFIDKTVFEG